MKCSRILIVFCICQSLLGKKKVLLMKLLNMCISNVGHRILLEGEMIYFSSTFQHINDISLRIDLEATLKKAEAIYRQIASSPNVPDSVRTVLGLPPQENPKAPQPQQTTKKVK